MKTKYNILIIPLRIGAPGQQAVKHQTLGFGSGHDLGVVTLSPE